MYRLYVIPFVVLLASAIGVTLAESMIAGTILMISFIACLGCVPPLSKRHLGLGYAALIVPFVIVALVFLYWMPVMGDGRSPRPDKNPPSKAPEPTPMSVTPPTEQKPRQP
jgi:hypothetical protein